jgi:hypothetical protein
MESAAGDAPSGAAREFARWPIALAVAMLLAAPAIAWFGPWRHTEPKALQARGARLFDGNEPLTATLAGRTEPLAAGAARCSQCHAGPRAKDPKASMATVLDRYHLREALPRRGSQPVSYDLATFCQALRNGTDPARGALPSAMPRFEIDDVRCGALWAYVTQAPS